LVGARVAHCPWGPRHYSSFFVMDVRVHHKMLCLRMPPPRLRTVWHQLNHIRPQTRCFASGREVVDLAYDLHEPPEAGPRNNPIVFIHGFFGSKKNNRSMSKYVCGSSNLLPVTKISFRVLARDLNRPIYAIVSSVSSPNSFPESNQLTAFPGRTFATMANHRTIPRTITAPSPPTSPPSSLNMPSRIRP
jgi:hypothetical protein